jgi:hypothetical protein
MTLLLYILRYRYMYYTPIYTLIGADIVKSRVMGHPNDIIEEGEKSTVRSRD